MSYSFTVTNAVSTVTINTNAILVQMPNTVDVYAALWTSGTAYDRGNKEIGRAHF
jgi:hypothetical protein